MAELLTEA